MKTALITLSNQGAQVITQLQGDLPAATCYLHETVGEQWQGIRFARIIDLTERIFHDFEGLVYVTPCGMVVRAIAAHIQHKTKDPAVVSVDVGARYAISLLSGHEGGANDLAYRVANSLGAEPVISTSSEAAKDIIVGIGCRRGVPAAAIVHAVREGLRKIELEPRHVRLLTSAQVKADEPGLREAADVLALPLRFIPDEEIRNKPKEFQETPAAQRNVNLPAVAEPTALLAGRRTSLLLQKTVYEGVTIAIARENCPSLASARDIP